MTAVAIAPDGSWLASGHEDGSVRIWDRVTGEQRAVLTGQAEAVTAVAIAPDGSWLASGDFAVVRIWDPATGQLRAVLTGQAEAVTAVAIAPDGSWLASGGENGSVRIWDSPSGEQPAVLTGHADRKSGGRRRIAVPDGTWLPSDGSVQIRVPPAGQLDTVRAEHIRRMSTVAFASDGSWLASGGEDGSVRIWDTVTGEQRAVLAGPPTGRPPASSALSSPPGAAG